MKALIVDDEAQARNILKHHLEEVDADIDVVAEASDVPSAVRSIQQHHPDIVFLDIEMPGQDGFSLFDYIHQPDFMVIFVTASRDYAIDAFRVSALDYILKPIDRNQLEEALTKASGQHLASLKQQVDMLDDQLASPSGEVSRLVLSTNQSIDFIHTNTISYLKADGAYTEFILEDGRTIVVSKPLGDYQFLETNTGFFKTHRSYMVNLSQVARFIKDNGGAVIMKNGDEVGISRYRKEAFLEAMSDS